MTCSIITCPANKKLSAIHDRMPVIIDQNYFQQWLAEKEEKQIKSLLMPFEDKLMETYRISNLINSPGNVGKEVLNPVN